MIWFAEAYRWAGGQTGLGVLNPTTVPQGVRGALVGRDIVLGEIHPH